MGVEKELSGGDILRRTEWKEESLGTAGEGELPGTETGK